MITKKAYRFDGIGRVGRRLRMAAIVVPATLAALLMCSSSAGADGGPSIASAPTVTYGTQEFGNLNNGEAVQGSCENTQYREFWLLPVTIGDRVTVNWEIEGWMSDGSESVAGVFVLPVGTNDYNIDNANDITSQNPNSEGKNTSTFTATQTGNIVLDFKNSTYGCLNGPLFAYDFTAYVLHAMALGLPHVSSVREHQRIAVAVSSPGGGQVSGPAVQLQLAYRGKWYVAGSATATNGVATVRLSYSRSLRGKRLRFRAVASGSSYMRATSQPESVKLR